MQCTKQPRFLLHRPVQITNVWEVRLAMHQWQRIRHLAALRRRTYSTITRYCVLRLARKASLHWTPRLKSARAAAKETHAQRQGMHRHMLCLYGDDEKLIRIAAMDLGMTVTGFIRLALELYLDSLAMEKRSKRFVSDETLTWEGIRLIEEIQIFAENTSIWPYQRSMNCFRFAFESYW